MSTNKFVSKYILAEAQRILEEDSDKSQMKTSNSLKMHRHKMAMPIIQVIKNALIRKI